MSRAATARDLVVLVAEGTIKAGPGSLRGRHQALGIVPIGYDISVVFDFHGSGRERSDPLALEQDVVQRLEASGWAGRAGVVVLDPELEAWVRSDSPQVDDALGWAGKRPHLRSWLRARGALPDGGGKPDRPKEAMEAARWERVSASAAVRPPPSCGFAACCAAGLAGPTTPARPLGTFGGMGVRKACAGAARPRRAEAGIRRRAARRGRARDADPPGHCSPARPTHRPLGRRRRAGRLPNPDPLHRHLQPGRPAGDHPPCGFTPEGLPVGLQLIGRAFDEVSVSAPRGLYESLTEWRVARHARRPNHSG